MARRIVMKTQDGKEVIIREGTTDIFKKTVKRVTLFAAATVLVAGGIKFVSKNDKDEKLKFRTSEHFEMMDSNSIESNDNSLVFNNNESINPESDAEFSKLKFLQESLGLNYEEIRRVVKEYSNYFNYTYEEGLDVVYNKRVNNIQNISYEKPETQIIYSLCESAENEGRVNYHCTEDWQIEKRYIAFPNSYYDPIEMEAKLKQCSEIEPILLHYCDDLGIEGEDINIALAVFRLEADWGASYRSVDDNNYGGIVFDNEYAIFSNPDYGMIKTLDVIKGYINSAKNDGCYDIESIIMHMAPSYCTHTPEAWMNEIYPMYLMVSEEYNYDNKNLVR